MLVGTQNLCDIDGKGNQAAGTSTTSKNETDEAQVQFDIPRTVYTKEAGSATLIRHLDGSSNSTDSISSRTVTHDPVSSVSDFASKTAAYNEFLGKESTKMGRSVGVNSNDETSGDSVESPACG